MKNLEELRRIRDEVRKGMDLRNGRQSVRVSVCMGTCGIAAGARDTMKALLEALEEAAAGDVAVTATGCAGFCEQEPLVLVEAREGQPVRYGHVNPAAAGRIVREHIIAGHVVQDLVF